MGDQGDEQVVAPQLRPKMMTQNIPPIAIFDDECGTEKTNLGPKWDRWLMRFENYLVALGVDDNKMKRSTLLHLVGPRTFDEFMTIPNTGGEADYATCKQKLTDHFKPQVNIEYEICKFRRLRQSRDETIDAYQTRCKQQGKLCSFADLDAELKSHILQTTTDSKLRKKGLGENLSLEQVLKEGRNNELCRAQNADMERVLKKESQSQNNTTQEVNRLYNKPKERSHKKPSSQQTQERSGSRGTCNFCAGPFPHKGGRYGCPAWGKTCSSCSKPNHFAKACKGKKTGQSNRSQGQGHRQKHKVHEVHQQPSDDEDYLFCITVDCNDECTDCNTNECDSVNIDDTCTDESVNKVYVAKPPKFNVSIDGVSDIVMTADSAATCSVIDQTTYENKLSEYVKLEESRDTINPYGGNSNIKPLGKFNGTVLCGDKHCVELFYVLPGNYGCLLSIKASQKLDLLYISDQVLCQRPQQYFEVFDDQDLNDVNGLEQFKGDDVAEQLIREYPEVCTGIGKKTDCQVDLHIDESVPPVAQPHRRVPFHIRKKLETKLCKLQGADILERPDGPTPWVSPVIATPKPSDPDDIRICVDMRQANKAIIRERHPMPTVEDVKAELNGSKKFSKVDLREGYHQMELSKRSREITTFSTHIGLFRYKRLNFGISSASEVFQNIIQNMLHGIKGAMNISDDIIIHGATQQEHDDALHAVFQTLKENGLTINPRKCEFNKDKIEYFGLVFSADGVQPSPRRIEAVLNMSKPSNRDEVLSLIGMFNYSSSFIPNYSTITAPLRRLTKENVKFVWGDEQENAYDTLIKHLASNPTLAYFDINKELEIFVDASPVGLGAIMTHPEGEEHSIVAYGSRSLTETEQRYAQIEREALACVWACEYFHLYVFGAPVTIVTDHKPLINLFGNPKAKLPARIERWAMRLEPYQIKIRYQKGKDNPADYLSRHPPDDSTMISAQEKAAEEHINFIAKHAVPKAMTQQEIMEATDNDATLCAVRDLVRSNRWYLAEQQQLQSPNIDYQALMCYSKLKYELSVTSGGIVLRGTRMCVPGSLQKRVVEIAHEGHQGITKTKALIREKVWFPGVDEAVKNIVSCCVPCKANTDTKPRAPLIMTELPSRPWANICSDFYGPLPSGHYLMAILDEYTRFPEVEIIKSLSAKTVIPCMDKVFSSRGIPEKVKTDNGPPFQSEEFSNFARELGFLHRKVTPYWPEANGQAENFMKNLGKTVKSAQLEGKPWKQELYRFLRNYRATPHTSTGIAPATALNGYPMKTKLPEIITHEEKSNIRQSDSVSKQKMKYYAEKWRNIQKSEVEVGDQVLMKNVTKKGKLMPKFHEEPFEVITKKGTMLVAQRGSEVKARNSSHFKKIHTEEEPLQVQDEDPIDTPDPVIQMPLPPPPLPPLYPPSPDPPVTPKARKGQAQMTPGPSPQATPPARPRRQIKTPRHLADYEVKMPKISK